MSVINQMLRDLDERQREPAPESPPIPALAPRSRARPVPDRRAWIAVVALISCALLFAGLYLWQRSPGNIVTPVAESQTGSGSATVADGDESQALSADEITVTDRSSKGEEAAVALRRAPVPDRETQMPSRPVENPVVAGQEILPDETAANDEIVLPADRSVVESLKSSANNPELAAVSAGSEAFKSAEEVAVGDTVYSASGTVTTKPVKQAVADRRLDPGPAALERARRYLNQGRLSETEAALREALAADPSIHSARETLAALLIRGGRTGEASSLVDEGMQISPEHSAFGLLKARLLVEKGRIRPAVSLLEKTAPGPGENETRLVLLAGLYRQLGRHEQALAAYKKAVKQNPLSATSWAGMAITLEALDRSEQARKAYRRALALPGLAQSVSSYSRQRLALLNRNQ